MQGPFDGKSLAELETCMRELARIASWETSLSRASNITQRAYYFYAPYAPEGRRDVRNICLIAAHAARIRAVNLGGSQETYAAWIPDPRPETR